MSFKKIWKNEKGATAALAAVAFTAIAALSGLVVDLGIVYIEGSSMQNAADAAAYAAAPLLPIYTSDSNETQNAQSVATTYTTRNSIESETIEGIELSDVVNGRYTSLKVTLNDQVPYNFGPIVGLQGADVTKSAKVQLEAATSCSKMVPLGTTKTQFHLAMVANGAQNVIVKYGSGDGETGFFGALDLDGVKGGGAKDFATWLEFGYDGVLNIGDILPVETGNMTGPTTSAFTARYSQCTHFPSQGGCNADHYNPDCARVVYLLIYEMVDIHTVQIYGFVPFVLVGTDGNGEVIASHIDVYVNQGESTELDENNIYYGMYRVRLTE